MTPLFEPGRNCWKIARADRAAVIIDACAYYRIIRQAMIEAEQRILIIGWDFDPRICLMPGSTDETLGGFLLSLAHRKRHSTIAILKWNFGALKSLFRGTAMLWILRLAMTKAIRFKLDGAHPPGCSHHQKIVVIDNCFAICGGIDMTRHRWDTSAHADDEPRRLGPDGRPYPPWHDATMAVTGDVAEALSELARDRWQRATGETLGPVRGADAIWPDELEAQFTGVDLAIVRTIAEYKGQPEVKEVEALFIDMIKAAKRFIYAENQYFTSPRIAKAIIERLGAPDPPEIVLVGPIKAEGWLEQKAMDAARVRMAQIIGRADPENRFRIYTPVTDGGGDIYVHAKVMIVDDEILRVGSSNWNNRSLGLDSECDLAFQASTDEHRATIAALRTRLMAEHLGAEPEEVERSFAETGSLNRTIEAFGGGKCLRLLELEKPSADEEFVAETELLDPKSPDEMFEAFTRRSLFSGLGGFVGRHFRSAG